MQRAVRLLLSITLAVLASASPSFGQDEEMRLMTELTETMEKALSAPDPCPYFSRAAELMRRLTQLDPITAEAMKPIVDEMAAGARECSSGAAAPPPATASQGPTSSGTGSSASAGAASSGPRLELAELAHSITRAAVTSDILRELIDLGVSLGHAYFEHRQGSRLRHTNKFDDAEADSRGFRKRESDNFIAYYREGDMRRAETTLEFAEESKGRMLELFRHFPDSTVRDGEKLPIYLAADHDEYRRLSNCTEASIACVSHIAYEDGMKQTMYVSTNAYAPGVDSYRQTVIHEIAHYTQFDLVDPPNVKNLRPWLIEGLASYAAGETDRLAALGQAYGAGQVVPIRDLMTLQGAAAYNSPRMPLLYSEGHSILQMIEDSRGVATVTQFVLAASRRTTIEGAARETLQVDIQGLDVQWASYLRSQYGR